LFTPHIARIPYLSALRAICRAHDARCWLTGGFLRDCARGRPFVKYDFDFTVSGDVESIARLLADEIGGSAVLLDKEKRSVRVTKKRRGGTLDIDLNAMRAETIEEDLCMRDITVNALGVDVMARRKEIIDVCGSRADIASRTIRVFRRENLTDDPLRIVRVFRFMAQLDGSLDPQTAAYARTLAQAVSEAAGERVADELFKIFAQPHAARIIARMDECGVLSVIMPELEAMRGMEQGDYHHLDVLAHSFEALRSYEAWCSKKTVRHLLIDPYLDEDVAQGRTRRQLLKLAVLLHDVGKPRARADGETRTTFYEHDRFGAQIAGDICARLKMSGKETAFVQKIVALHMRPGMLADLERLTPRAAYRFFRDCKGDGAGVIIAGLSDWRATCGPGIDTTRRALHERILMRLADDYFAHLAARPLRPLLTGAQLLEMGFLPGPLIGTIMEDLAERRALGEIGTKQAAQTHVRKTYGDQRR
jgi:putative nucleotidyltransferase with HDIG domain